MDIKFLWYLMINFYNNETLSSEPCCTFLLISFTIIHTEFRLCLLIDFCNNRLNDNDSLTMQEYKFNMYEINAQNRLKDDICPLTFGSTNILRTIFYYG